MVSMTVNGIPRSWDALPGDSLADLLRKNHLLSVKIGCNEGACGSCTVWVDGRPMLSCSIPALRMQERSITTVEGVREEAARFADFLVGEGADQCGYCSPGLVMTVLAMARNKSVRTPREIRRYLNGNLCRCSGYLGSLRAIKKYLASVD